MIPPLLFSSLMLDDSKDNNNDYGDDDAVDIYEDGDDGDDNSILDHDCRVEDGSLAGIGTVKGK